MDDVQTATVLRRARHRAGLTQRELAALAETAHSAIAAYEGSAKIPRVDTLERLLRAAGAEPELVLAHRPDSGLDARVRKGRELEAALDLAAMFPAGRRSPLPPPVIRPRA